MVNDKIVIFLLFISLIDIYFGSDINDFATDSLHLSYTNMFIGCLSGEIYLLTSFNSMYLMEPAFFFINGSEISFTKFPNVFIVLGLVDDTKFALDTIKLDADEEDD